MILLIDHYDSFVYNLGRYFEVLGCKTLIYRHDKITLPEIEKLKPSHIVISPGPGTPKQTGISINIIKYFSSRIPILGVCLGHQTIGYTFGAKVCHADHPMHGKASKIYHNQHALFIKIPNPFSAGRYHSLIISKNQFPDCLTIIAENKEGEIMAICHRVYPIFGVQFHPESIMTEQGLQLLSNFVEIDHANTCK
ncbi:anthranilate synthase component II [Coxiella endosymbiont of Amblyomma americanum]|uniref:anthranilate synthase component II n=1 Tax=Coxiella endosymbiont of Amblyomma americanum TaxID=325775 RepID=UPI0005802FC1|nr:aminodeoxychorismate/anthranilate synthase component II [Coxiella endosymbiont of Amblyomma americanum]AJC50344.1 anthranilate synthase component II [Coxiella endosymbiont of Amblyomma americanum]AUJ58690.1 glutamine amidotransferase [Coxiella-like endosymbiont of Amblyomma americanum]